jgi:hypothetical protein
LQSPLQPGAGCHGPRACCNIHGRIEFVALEQLIPCTFTWPAPRAEGQRHEEGFSKALVHEAPGSWAFQVHGLHGLIGLTQKGAKARPGLTRKEPDSSPGPCTFAWPTPRAEGWRPEEGAGEALVHEARAHGCTESMASVA